MAKVIVTKSKLDSLATVISAKSGVSKPMTIDQMASAVSSISGGGSAPTLQTKSAVPMETAQTITPDTGYDGLSSVEIGAISLTYVGSGIPRRDASSVTTSGASVSIPSGYYQTTATKTISSGTEGTPTATKGNVSNHSVSVTPSVTNSAGYISGGTKTGTAVSVSASELVSGTLNVTSNGTHDVTNYESVDVDIPSAASMNVQMYNGYDYSASTSYVDTDVTLTVAQTGTYDISWVGWRNTTSGTSGSRLYIDGVAYGTAVTTFKGSYGQSVNLSDVSLNAGDVLVVRARARSTSYKMYVANLVIVQTS